MENPEEPEYQMFEYVCEKCGERFKQASARRLHPDHQDCPFCIKILETVTGAKVWSAGAKGELR